VQHATALARWRGHFGSPAPFGSPLRAKFAQYAVMASESFRSMGSQGTFGSDSSSAPKTYSISPACRAPMSREVAGIPMAVSPAGTGIFRSNE
jgi:hypothetical protein